MDSKERIRTLEEIVHLLESIKVDPTRLSELDFDDARVDGYLTTALSAARSALAVATERESAPKDIR